MLNLKVVGMLRPHERLSTVGNRVFVTVRRCGRACAVGFGRPSPPERRRAGQGRWQRASAPQHLRRRAAPDPRGARAAAACAASTTCRLPTSRTRKPSRVSRCSSTASGTASRAFGPGTHPAPPAESAQRSDAYRLVVSHIFIHVNIWGCCDKNIMRVIFVVVS